MSAVVDLLNRWGVTFTALAGVGLWQATVVAVVVALAALALRRSSPALRYWLWQLVAIKLLLLPLGSWSVGLAWLPALQSETVAHQTVLSDSRQSEVVVQPTPQVSFPEVTPPSPAPLVVADEAAAADEVAAEVSLEAPAARVANEAVSQATPVAFQQRPVLVSFVAKLTWQAWLLLGWAMIVIVQVVRLVVQRRRLGRMLKGTVPGGAELVAVVNQIATQLQMRPPAVAVTQLDCSPFACGIWRPRVVVPASLLVELDAVQLKQVLAHELAHLKRHDLVWGWITELARLLYFFNPAMLLAARQARLERELACDQIAMRLSGRGPAEYADTLVRVLSSAAATSAFRTAAASLDGGQRELRRGEGDR